MDFNIQDILEKYYTNDEKLVLACSGGPDSMYILYHILDTKYKDNLVLCYFNHKLRLEANLEENYLRELARENNIIFESQSINIKKILLNNPSASLEEFAREKRYEFLYKIADKYTTSKIITGHHLDDRVETFLFNLLRGSKLTGLINMREFDGKILRPLINLEKDEILKYLDKSNLKYFIDKSNLENIYTRNKIRNTIIPKFYDININFKNNIKNTLNYFEELKNHINIEVLNFVNTYAGNHFLIEDFNSKSPLLQREIIRYLFYISNNNSTIGLSEANIGEIIKFINSPNNKTKKYIKNLKLHKDGKKIVYVK